jgi:hypothetical protein
MNIKRIIAPVSIGGLALVALLLAAMGAWAAPDERVQAAPLAPAAVVSDTISYQGRLLDSSGDPVDGTQVMTFSLYADPTSTTSLWSQSRSVSADDGLFNVHLDINPGLFSGRALWLGVQLAGEAEMTPRQPLLPAPYALSLRPGAAISGTVGGAPTLNVASASDIGLHANTLSTDPMDAAVLGENFGAGRGVAGYSGHEVAVYGQSANGPAGFFTSTNSVGVRANTLSSDPNDAAVVGENEGSGHGGVFFSANGYGVYGESASATDAAGYFTSTNSVGVRANTLSSDPNDAAVVGENEGSGHGGVFFSANGDGIYVGEAGSDGLRILDTVGGNYIHAGSGADPDFIVTNNGTVYADGAYNCGIGPGGEPGTCVIQNSPADFAEMLPCDDGLEPGDVLVVGPDGKLARSTQAYQSTVVGVYSTQPGYLGGGEHRGHEGYAPLAVVGIVPVKASAENGPIRPGDLLVASATPAHAMKAGPNPPQGTILGKALEPLDTSTGTILVLVMLQ